MTADANETPGGSPAGRPGLLARLPFYYGWIVVAVAFVTLGVGVNVRTAFSLLYPPILDEFGWPRADTAAIFSVGFATSMLITPFIGVAVNRLGPGVVMATGSVLVGGGLVLATFAGGQSLIFLSLGCAVVGGAIILGYTGHAYLMPFWFVRRRGLATGLAFSGAGVGSILLFPWWQDIIREDGWREACLTMALILFVLVLPLNLLLQRRRPEDMGLRPDGERAAQTASGEPAGSASEKSAAVPDTVVDAEWAARDWSLREAMLTARFWWLGLGLFFGMYVWYAVQVHQTQYLGEIGFSATAAAFALGLVGLFGVVGQIGMGGLSDRIGREWAWTLSTLGFAVCYALLILMRENPSQLLLWLMVAGQGALGYGLASVFGAILAEVFQCRRFGQIFGAFGMIISLGAACGPWLTGELYDRTGSYDLAWWAALGACALSILGMWMGAPRKVRLVSGIAKRRAA
ncbi:MAG: MFS transporter [Rhodospirillaceae bacterium]|nr:MFS transporter [Rhodospirillaceae bacterium]MDE0619499.1 MFS transporter [Rhodospirillaceae bacterium]